MSITESVKDLMQKIVKAFSAGISQDEAPSIGAGEFEIKYRAFQSLLDRNKSVHLLLADMKEKLSGEYLFDQQYIHASVQSVSDGVQTIVRLLDELSNGKYKALQGRYDSVSNEIGRVLFPRGEIPVSDLVIPLAALRKEMTDVAGGKIAHLGEISGGLGLPAPEGFSITAYAFKRFIEYDGLLEKVDGKLAELNIRSMDAMNRCCSEIQEMVAGAAVPAELEEAVRKAVRQVKRGSPDSALLFSVRSSAVLEDGEASFAGQYDTFLNVPEEAIMQRYKQVIASLFRPRAVFYFKTKGFSNAEMVMPVGVVRMIEAIAGGVVYSRDPIDPNSDRISINAAWGLGKAVVDGAVAPDVYTVSRTTGRLLESMIGEQRTMLVCDPRGGIIEAPVPEGLRNAPCLNNDQITALARYAGELEAHYGKPQDIEWAVDAKDRIYLFQSRPLRMMEEQPDLASIPRRLEHYTILTDKGRSANKGIGYGRAFIAGMGADLTNFPDRGVLVAPNMSTDFVLVMDRAAAIVTDTGGIAGHMALLAREYGVPTIADAVSATRNIRDGQEVTVDAVNCTVYEGRIDELLKFTSPRSTFRETTILQTLERVLERMAPLNLVSPDVPDFRPENCRSFHDITRFAHQKAMSEMFLMGKGQESKKNTIPLGKKGPLDAHFIDMDGCVEEGVKVAAPEDIHSIPFSAFLRGVFSIPWPEPRPTDMTGLLGMMATIATTSESELYRAGQQSFALIARQYMNFSIRLGYHFSMVEAYAGENEQDNYIKFFFKGGGASVDRRLRRVRLMTEILKRMGFRVTITQDVINADLAKYRREEIEKKCEIMGRLTVYTKQLDLVMYNDALIDQRIEEFTRDHMQ